MKRAIFILAALGLVASFLLTANREPRRPRGVVVVETKQPIETVLQNPPPAHSPPATVTVRLESVAPTFEFDRPCEPAWARMQRERIVLELKELLGHMSLEEQEAFLVAVYDAQENLAMVDAPSTDVYFAFSQDLHRIFGDRAMEMIMEQHPYAVMMGAVETRALRTGREFITDEAWFKSHRIPYACPKT